MVNNIVYRVTRKYMKLNRRRTAVTFIGIVFMVMLMTCVFAGKETALGYMRKVASLDKGSWHMIAYDVTSDEAEEIAARDDVEETGYSEALGVLDFPQTGDSENKPFLDVKAYSTESFELANISLAEGRLPENSGEIVLSESVTEDGSEIKVGDRISGDYFTRRIVSKHEGDGATMFPFENIELKYGSSTDVPNTFMAWFENPDYDEERVYSDLSGDYKVVGFIHAPSFEESSGAAYPALTVYEGTQTGRVNMFLVFDLDKVKSAYELRHDICDSIGRDISFETNELLLAFSAKGDDSNISGLTVFVEIFFTVLIMAASVILIYNVFNMSFAERARYLGMLSSVGATGRQKRQSIYYECFALLIPALPVGILTGMGIVYGGMQMLKPQLARLIDMVKFGVSSDIPVSLCFGLPELGLIVGMCIVTVMISALIPAVKISRVGAVESIRGNTEQVKKKRFKTKNDLLEKGRPELLLAVNSTRRTKHLTRSIVRSITIFATLAMVTLYGAQSVIKVLDIMSSEEGWDYVPECYDYLVATTTSEGSAGNDVIEQMLSDDAVTDVKKLDCIYVGPRLVGGCVSDDFNSAIKEIYFQYSDNTQEGWERFSESINDSYEVTCVVVDDEEYRYLAEQGDADMSVVNEPSVLVYNELLLSTDYYQLGDKLKGYKCIEVNDVLSTAIGGDVSFEGYDIKNDKPGNASVKLAGYVDRESVKERFKVRANSIFLFMNRSGLEELMKNMECRNEALYLFSTDKEKDSALISKLSDYCESTINDPEKSECIIMNYSDRNQGMTIKQAISSIIRILAYCFTVLVSIVCLLNLYNSIRGRAAERTRETAMLRSVGMTEKQLTKMRDIESLMLLGRGLAYAAVICGVLIAVMYRFMSGYFGRVELPIPWLLTAGIAAVVGLASFVLTRVCCRSADKTSIVDEIRCETV